MRWPRKGILIRLCIYVPLVAYFSWRALDRERGDEAAVEDDLDRKLAPHKRMVTLPDGTQQEIVELTPDQAEAILGPIPALDRREPAAAPATDAAPAEPTEAAPSSGGR